MVLVDAKVLLDVLTNNRVLGRMVPRQTGACGGGWARDQSDHPYGTGTRFPDAG